MAELANNLATSEEQRLDHAEAVVRGFCGWHIAPARTESLTVRTFGGNAILLPSLHVTAVASVTEAESALTLTDDYHWLTPSSIIRRPAGWGYDTEVVVEFTHGYAMVPADVEAVVMAVAQRATDNPGSLSQEAAGPFNAKRAGTGATLELLEAEKAILRRYRVPAIA